MGRGLLSVLWSGGLIDPLGGSIQCTVGEPCPRPPGDGGVQVRINVLGDVGGHLCGHGWNGTWNWLVVVLLEPFHQVIYTAMSLVPVPESIWGDTHIFDPWFPCWLIGQHELPRILL